MLSSADEDFTIAIPRKQYSGEVNLTFQHMLSKITVTAQLSSELIKGGYTISSGYTATLLVPYNKSTIDAVSPSE